MAVSFTGAAERLTDDDVEKAAQLLGVEEACMWAVVEVESNGRGFYADGSLKALFEPHVFYKRLSGTKLQRAIAAGLAYKKYGTKRYPANSYERIRAAMKIDETAALASTSWGMGQLMGYNCIAAGYQTPQAMVAAFIEGEGEQLMAMARFIRANKMVAALKAKAWAKFARQYNGPAYATNRYDVKLAAAYRKHSKPAIVSLLDTDALEDDEERGVMPDSGGEGLDEELTAAPAGAAEPPAKAVVEAVQKQLCEMGYFDVGKIDGNPGGKTYGSVAAFMTDRTAGAEKSGELTEEAIREIGEAHSEGFQRPIAESRASATLAEISKQVPAVKELVTTENVLKGGKMAFGAVTGGTVAAKATGADNAIAAAASGVPPIVWIGLALAAFGALIYGVSWYVKRATAKAATDYRIGKRA